MAEVYILYSQSLDRFYIGSCQEITGRVNQHLSDYFPGAFTSKAKDWIVFYCLKGLGYQQARGIESHIKRMKSRKYIENLKKYAEVSQKLILQYLHQNK